jgi:aminopeptidase N
MHCSLRYKQLMKRLFAVTVVLAASCGASSSTLDAANDVGPLAATANLARGISSTALAVNSDALTATATMIIEPSATPGATFEIGDIDIVDVQQQAAGSIMAIPWIDRGATVDLGLPASSTALTVVISYKFSKHSNFDGFTSSSGGAYTLVWPYYCGNLFPCHSRPDDGTEFSVTVAPPASGLKVVAPVGVIKEAPSYQLAWAIGDYADVELGTSSGGTKIITSYLTGQLADAQKGGAHLVAAFSWLESTIGPYRFGPQAGTVSVKWGPGAFGGMEHHPRWHVASAALGDEETNIHEAAHGWFGDGIRIACWEDFVLSEGTVTYLAGRALDVVAPTVGAAVWQSYASGLAAVAGTQPVWPTTCNQIDIIKDKLFSRAPYMRGAFFYRAVAGKVGADKLDQALAKFYQVNAGKAARMSDMLTTIASETGFDPTSCAQSWLRSTTIPAIGPCP